MLKNYLRKTNMRRGVLTESSSAAPHNFQARKMYFDVLLDNLKNSDIPALKKFYDIEPIFDSKQKYSMTIESIDSRYPNLEFNYAVYEPISVFVGTECSYTTIKRTAELLEQLLPLIDDATLNAYGRVFNHKNK
jgi:hypothetical protein